MMTMRGVAEPRLLDDVAITLTDAEREDLRADITYRAHARLGTGLDDEDLLADAARSSSALPTRLGDALRRFREPGELTGGMLIRNLPVDGRLCPTPADGYVSDWGAVPVATFTQLAVTAALGEVIAYADEKSGNLVQDVVPMAGAQERQENSGTVYLELHTEDGFHPHKPDFITLLCLRPDDERAGMTVVGAVQDALPLMHPDHTATLREPAFRLRVASSFAAGSPSSTGPMAVLSGPPDRPHLVADFYATTPMTDAAAAALHDLKRAMLGVLWGTCLHVGDLLVVDNRTAVHGRTAFTARYDGRDRWLRRCFAVADLNPSKPVRQSGSRLIAPLADVMAAPAGRGTEANR